MRHLLVVLALLLAGCGAPSPRWDPGATLLTLEERPPVRPEDVRVYYKRAFSVFDPKTERAPRACHATTLLRQAWAVPNAPTDEPPGDDVEAVAVLTTGEYPRDDDRSRLRGAEFTRVLGIGKDEFDLFVVVPDPASTERGLRELRERAARLGCDEVRDVYYTGQAEHQMWEGSAWSFTPITPRSPFYVNARLLELRLRDVQFHGVAVRRIGS